MGKKKKKGDGEKWEKGKGAFVIRWDRGRGGTGGEKSSRLFAPKQTYAKVIFTTEGYKGMGKKRALFKCRPVALVGGKESAGNTEGNNCRWNNQEIRSEKGGWGWLKKTREL